MARPTRSESDAQGLGGALLSRGVAGAGGDQGRLNFYLVKH
jgi:hypothetical protein